MFSGIATVLTVAIVLAAAYRYAAGPGRHVVERFDRYPPHAPMSDWPALGDLPGRVAPRGLAVLRTRQVCAGDRRIPMRPTEVR
ncbi:hypothetical protein [Nocardia spumae]|uniref:hypothetical protein n=1 Tax=Nocardia spumae TaxID=2887190 RepID=UPI001D152033|nr:hypothetical protein [Nocardia spumae]